MRRRSTRAEGRGGLPRSLEFVTLELHDPSVFNKNCARQQLVQNPSTISSILPRAGERDQRSQRAGAGATALRALCLKGVPLFPLSLSVFQLQIVAILYGNDTPTQPNLNPPTSQPTDQQPTRTRYKQFPTNKNEMLWTLPDLKISSQEP